MIKSDVLGIIQDMAVPIRGEVEFLIYAKLASAEFDQQVISREASLSVFTLRGKSKVHFILTDNSTMIYLPITYKEFNKQLKI